MRKGLDDKIHTALTIANITNIKRRSNVEYDPNHTRTGLFREYEEFVFAKVIESGFDGTYVQSVHNQFLPDVLLRYGYTRVNIRGLGDYQEHNYWRSAK